MFKNRPTHMKVVESGGLFLINNPTENVKIVGKMQHNELVQRELGSRYPGCRHESHTKRSLFHNKCANKQTYSNEHV